MCVKFCPDIIVATQLATSLKRLHRYNDHKMDVYITGKFCVGVQEDFLKFGFSNPMLKSYSESWKEEDFCKFFKSKPQWFTPTYPSGCYAFNTETFFESLKGNYSDSAIHQKLVEILILKSNYKWRHYRSCNLL